MMAWIKKHDLITKAVALVGAFVLWFFVIKVVDPVKTDTIVVPVQLTNMEALNQNGYVVTSGTVLQGTIKLEGRYNQVTKVVSAPEDYGYLYINMARIADPSQTQHRANWQWEGNNTPEVNIEVIGSIFLRIEKMEKAVVPVQFELDNEPTDNSYTFQKLATNPSVIVVEGPESIVDQIAYAEVRYDVSNLKENIDDVQREVVFKNADGNEVNVDSEFVTISDSTVAVSLRVSHAKQVNLLVDWKVPDFLSGDAFVTSTSPTNITVTGQPDEVEKVNNIYLGEINLQAFLENDALYEQGYVEFEIVVPNGVASDMNGTMAKVYIEVPGYLRQKMTVDQALLPQSSLYEYLDPSLELTLFGPGDETQSALAEPGELIFELAFDPENAEPGEHEADLLVSCRDGDVHVIGKYKVRILVHEPEESTDPEGND